MSILATGAVASHGDALSYFPFPIGFVAAGRWPQSFPPPVAG